jgi:hypothetical protein
LTVYYLDQSQIKLSWDTAKPLATKTKPSVQTQPLDYKLDCYKCITPNYWIKKMKSSSSMRSKRNAICSDKIRCESYVKIEPNKEQSKTSMGQHSVSLTSLDSNTQYLLELYGQHSNGLFKTKTVDILVQTFEDVAAFAIRNLTVLEASDPNGQLLIMWQNPKMVKNATGYEIRYWAKDAQMEYAAQVFYVKGMCLRMMMMSYLPF